MHINSVLLTKFSTLPYFRKKINHWRLTKEALQMYCMFQLLWTLCSNMLKSQNAPLFLVSSPLINTFKPAALTSTYTPRTVWSKEPVGALKHLGEMKRKYGLCANHDYCWVNIQSINSNKLSHSHIWNNNLGQRSTNFFLKDQIVNILGSMRHMVSVPTSTHFYHYSPKAVTDILQKIFIKKKQRASWSWPMNLSLLALFLEWFITISSNLEKHVYKTFTPSNHTHLSENNERTN